MVSQSEKFTSPASELEWLGKTIREHTSHNNEQYIDTQAAQKVIEQYAHAEAKDFLHETQVLPVHETERLVLKLKPEAHDQKMEELFALILEKGIKNALDVAARLHDPHLEDDFHRFLVQYLHTVGALPGLKETASLFQELDHALFTITLPNTQTTSEKQDFKVFLQAMKQFYMGLLSLERGAYYSLELAVQNHGKDIALYASVPRNAIETFEKTVHAYYPGASIEEATDDYNIFNTQSGIAGATAMLAEPDIFPLNSETAFEHDPLAALISSLSQLATVGEGAAIQIIISKDEESNKTYAHVIEVVQKEPGKKVKDAYKEATESLLVGTGKALLSLFEKEKEIKKDAPVDQAGLALAITKNKSQGLRVGIRIVASASTLSRAQAIITTIKSSFNQFSLIGSNSIAWKDTKTARLFEFCQFFSFRTREQGTEMLLSIDELATIFHFPVGLITAPELKEATGSTAPAPSSMQKNGVLLGTNTYRGQTTEVYLSPEDRLRHCYVIGQTGTGKTTILKNMAIQDIKNGHGLCFIDPHGYDLNDILANIPPERMDDVIYFDPAYTARPMGLNMLEHDVNFPEQKIFVVNELLAIFNKLFDMKVAGGPAFEQYFRNSALLVMEDPESGSTLLEIGRVLSDKAFRDLKLSRCKNPIIKQFWENAERTTGEQSLANFVPYITNKFDIFISNDIMRPVISQQKSVLNFRDIMDNKKILLVNLSKGRLGDINSHLIGLVLVGKLTMAALSRADVLGKQAVNDFYLYIDEFQNVTTDSIATILSEARKYRLGLTVAHQFIEQLEEKIKNAVFGNVGSMIIYRVSPENANVFEAQLAPVFTPADILKLENFNAYAKILVNGVPEKAFNLRIPPPPPGNLELSEKIKELSYLKFGRPRDEVEAEVMARYQ